MIERRRGLDRETFLREYARPGRPVILEGATRGWNAMRTWSVDFLRERYGSHTVAVTRSEGPYARGVPMRFDAYVDYMRRQQDERPLYLTSWDVQDGLEDLLADFAVPECFADDWFGRLPAEVRPHLTWLFVGPSRAGSWLHLDIGMTAAWNVQLVGRKRWILFSPDQEPFLYGGEVDAFGPNRARHPLFGMARALECVLEPGEIIFTPSRWWHQTLALDEGIALTANYVDATNYRGVLAWMEQHQGWLEEKGMPRLYPAFAEVVRELIRPG